MRFGLDRESLFRTSILASVLFHLIVFGVFELHRRFGGFSDSSPIELDLTRPFRIGGNPLLKPGGGTTLVEPKRPGPPALREETPPVPEKKTGLKDWVLPGPGTRELEKPSPPPPSETSSPQGIEGGTGEGYQGTGGGFGGGEGEGGGIPISRFPQLLNRREILKLLRKNYPAVERAAGREGRVMVDLHIGADGNVTGVEVVGSAGSAFDRVAELVAGRMLFSPALVQNDAVAVKIRQAIVFEIEDDW